MAGDSKKLQPIIVKKIKKGGHGHHGGAWKIAYADFVTAMMALFMVLWLLASTDQKTRDEISNYFRTGILPDAELAMNGGATYVPSIIEKSPAPPPPDQQTLDDTVKSLKDAIAHMAENHVDLAEMAGKIKVVATPDGVLIEANDDDAGMLFDSASSRLKPGLEEFLRELDEAEAAGYSREDARAIVQRSAAPAVWAIDEQGAASAASSHWRDSGGSMDSRASARHHRSCDTACHSSRSSASTGEVVFHAPSSASRRTYAGQRASGANSSASAFGRERPRSAARKNGSRLPDFGRWRTPSGSRPTSMRRVSAFSWPCRHCTSGGSASTNASTRGSR